MTSVLRWPVQLMPRAVAFNPRGMTVGGPISLTGQSQLTAVDAGYWIATVSQMSIARPSAVKAFRAFRAKMEGGANHVLVPAFDPLQAPWAHPGGPKQNRHPDQAWSDGIDWSDGVGWYDPAIRVYLAEDAEARATQIVVDVTTAGDIVGGEYFSLVGGGMHVVREVVAEDGSELTLSIWPPLRASVKEGRRCNFELPVCKMRLLSEDEADLMLGHGRHGTSEMNFIEVF